MILSLIKDIAKDLSILLIGVASGLLLLVVAIVVWYVELNVKFWEWRRRGYWWHSFTI